MKACQLCQKSYQTATKRKKSRSQFNPTTTYRQQPNLQWYSAAVGKRLKVCMGCRRALISGKLSIKKINK